MGMFDTVITENFKLPKLPKEVQEFLDENNSSLPNNFQTKDLENLMNTYTLDKNGQIWESYSVATGRKVKKDNWFNWKDNRSFLEKLYFKFKFPEKKKPLLFPEFKQVKRKSKITSSFDIYIYEEVNGRYLDLTISVVAIKGKISKVVIKDHKIESKLDAEKRHKNDAEWALKLNEQFEARKKFMAKWYYPILKETYNPFVYFVRESLLWLLGKINNFLIRWRGI